MSDAATPVRLLSDERLTRRAVRGDERAFAAIFRRYHQSLYRFCLAIVGNPEDAQDVLQNTMTKVLRALPGEQRAIELRPWLYRIAHNESIDLLRRRRQSSELDVEQVAPGYGLAEDAATRERLRRLVADLRELPDRQREALVMRELGGLEFEEIAAALGTSGAVARQTLYEARQSLRQMEAGREMSCAAVTRALSDGDGRVTRRRDVRAHLRACPGCRGFREEIERRERDLAALAPLPAVAAVAAAGMLHGLLGGSQAAGGGGLAAALGGGAAKSIGASAAAKGLATAAVVAAIGVTAADRTGAIHLGLPGEQAAVPAKRGPAAPGGAAAGASVPRKRGLAAAAGGAAAASPRRAARAAARSAKATHVRSGQHGSPAASPASGPAPAGQAAGGFKHEGRQPPPAAHGQETAAAHKAPQEEGGSAAASPAGTKGSAPPRGAEAAPDQPPAPAAEAVPPEAPAAPAAPPGAAAGKGQGASSTPPGLEGNPGKGP